MKENTRTSWAHKTTSKKPKLGTGKRFANLKHTLANKGAKDPAALAAYIGRRALGKKQFQNLAVAGRKRHSK